MLRSSCVLPQDGGQCHPLDRAWLAGICKWFGHSSTRWRRVAYLYANRLVREAGLTWADVIRPDLPASIDREWLIQVCDSSSGSELFAKAYPAIHAISAQLANQIVHGARLRWEDVILPALPATAEAGGPSYA